MNAKISEVFESIQGEGIYLGIQQVFVRFFGCNLACSFCDTPQEKYSEYTVDQLRQEIVRYKGFHSVSLTGGEPLLQADFLESFLPTLSGSGFRTYLETNGTLAKELARLIDAVDIIAMDFKMPSSCGCPPLWSQHEHFLKIALAREVFIKMVITTQTSREDILTAGDIIKGVSPVVPIVLQANGKEPWDSLVEKMIAFKRELTLSGIDNIKILPQAHKLVGIR